MCVSCIKIHVIYVYLKYCYVSLHKDTHYMYVSIQRYILYVCVLNVIHMNLYKVNVIHMNLYKDTYYITVSHTR